MKILYIEDDVIDQKNCQIILNQKEDINLTVVDQFEKAFDFISKEKIDVLISDQRVGMDHFKDHWHQFLGIPYFIVSNSPDENLNTLLQPPLQLFQKPFQVEHSDNIVKKMESLKAEPNLSYAENITEGAPDLLTEMVFILKSQFEEGIDKIPYLYEKKNTEELIQVVHKLISKFSVLSMSESFSFFNRVEKCLRDQLTLNNFAYKRLVTDLQEGLNFINFYIKQHELHNS